MSNDRPNDGGSPLRFTARLGPIAIAVMCGLVLIGCTEQEPAPGTAHGEQLDESRAQARIQQYLTETLNALPPGVSLTKPPSEVDGKKLEFDLANLPAVPCDGNPDHTEGPKKAQVAYFLIGIPKGEVDRYLNDVIRIWSNRLWQTWPLIPDKQSNAVTLDGYMLAAQISPAGNPDGADGLALAGTSPCFANAATGTATPLPTAIEQARR
ncbi:hypothetical protein [Nocardia brasiliensis]